MTVGSCIPTRPPLGPVWRARCGGAATSSIPANGPPRNSSPTGIRFRSPTCPMVRCTMKPVSNSRLNSLDEFPTMRRPRVGGIGHADLPPCHAFRLGSEGCLSLQETLAVNEMSVVYSDRMPGTEWLPDPWERAAARSGKPRTSPALRAGIAGSGRHAAAGPPGGGRIAVRSAPRPPRRPSSADPMPRPHGKSLTLRRGLKPQEH
jgi:hypothetical protein